MFLLKQKVAHFSPFGIMADIFDCYTVCLFFFLFEMLQGCFVVDVGRCILLPYCISAHCAFWPRVHALTHSQQSPLSCALTKPCRNKRAKLLKRRQSSLCDHLLCPFFQSSSLRDKKPSACRQKSAALVLPPFPPTLPTSRGENISKWSTPHLSPQTLL